MEAKVQAFLDKLREMADKTGQAAGSAADAAGKKASELADATRMHLQIFDLNAECDTLYREIGHMVYDLHCGGEVENSKLEAKIAALDGKRKRIAALRAALDGRKQPAACPHCGHPCGRDAVFCPHCGSAL